MVIPLNVKIEKTLKKWRFKCTSQSHYSLNELEPSYFELIPPYVPTARCCMNYFNIILSIQPGLTMVPSFQVSQYIFFLISHPSDVYYKAYMNISSSLTFKRKKTSKWYNKILLYVAVYSHPPKLRHRWFRDRRMQSRRLKSKLIFN